MPAKTAVKTMLMRAGAALPAPYLQRVDWAVDFLHVGRWRKKRDLDIPVRVAAREELFDLAIGATGGTTLLYLEFGVFEGRSLEYWVSRVSDASAVFYGFDGYEGLPETWSLVSPKGTYSAGGKPPVIDDPRVRLFKGPFEETLPTVELPPHERLVVNVDCDLYSSTKTALSWVAPAVKSGTFVYFDEFTYRHHELKAFDEFLDDTAKRFRVAGTTRNYLSWLFECIG